MTTMNKKSSVKWTDCLLLLVSAAFPILTVTVFHACGAKEDGGWMTCHWAYVMLLGFGIVLAVLALLSLLIPSEGIKQGISIAMIPVSVLSALTPGTLISLCMMDSMSCRSRMQPASIILSIAILIFAVINAISHRRK